MENYINDAAVIPYSVFECIEMLPNDNDKALAYRTFVSNSLKDEFNLTGNPMIDIILTMARPNQISSAQRHRKSIENGGKGGRPQEIDRDVVINLRKNGYTQAQIAEEIGCSIRTVKRILSVTKGDITRHNLEIEKEIKKKIEKKIEDEKETDKKDFVPF